MDSPAKMHKWQQRLFAWVFALATIVVVSLLGLEILSPPMFLSTYAIAISPVLDLSAFDLNNLHLLVAAVALIALASFVGLVVATLKVHQEVRRTRTRAELESAFKKHDRMENRVEARTAIHGFVHEPREAGSTRKLYVA